MHNACSMCLTRLLIKFAPDLNTYIARNCNACFFGCEYTVYPLTFNAVLSLQIVVIEAAVTVIHGACVHKNNFIFI